MVNLLMWLASRFTRPSDDVLQLLPRPLPVAEP
jgi:hypothetical protein